MSQFDASIAADVLAACQTNAAEIGQTLTRALDATIEVSTVEASTFHPADMPPDFAGPGLAVVLAAADGGAVLALPESGAPLPPWYAQPDATGKSKLATLAQELGMLVLPESIVAASCDAVPVAHLGNALVQSGASSSPLVRLQLGQAGALFLVWPIARPAGLLTAAQQAPSTAPHAAPGAAPTAARSAADESGKPSPSGGGTGRTVSLVTAHEAPAATRRAASLTDLPSYTRSLLRVRVPVAVTLASSKQSVQRILELGPGTLIQFEKSCEEELDLEVGGQRVARGEAVKVGDKFGIRLTSIVLPDERFKPLRRHS